MYFVCFPVCKKEGEIKHTHVDLAVQKQSGQINWKSMKYLTEGWVGAWGRWGQGMWAPFLSLCLVLTLGSVLIFYLLKK